MRSGGSRSRTRPIKVRPFFVVDAWFRFVSESDAAVQARKDLLAAPVRSLKSVPEDGVLNVVPGAAEYAVDLKGIGISCVEARVNDRNVQLM